MCLSLQLNIMLILSSKKKAVELSFCSRLKRYVLMVSTLAFAFKIIRPIIFSAVKKVNFLLSRKFSLIKELVHSQGNFPWSKNFSTVIEIFHSQITFPQSSEFSSSHRNFQWKFSTVMEIFPQSSSFSTVIKISHSQGNFPLTRTFYTKKNILDQGNFPQTMKFYTNKSFPWSRKFSTNKDFYTVIKIVCIERSKRFSKSQNFRSILLNLM